jgi:hypothetical protein
METIWVRESHPELRILDFDRFAIDSEKIKKIIGINWRDFGSFSR